MTGDGKVSNQDLISKCFFYLNSFKRHRALANIKRLEGDRQQAEYHELKQYQFSDSLELGLRAIQKGMRDLEEVESDSE